MPHIPLCRSAGTDYKMSMSESLIQFLDKGEVLASEKMQLIFYQIVGLDQAVKDVLFPVSWPIARSYPTS